MHRQRNVFLAVEGGFITNVLQNRALYYGISFDKVKQVVFQKCAFKRRATRFFGGKYSNGVVEKTSLFSRYLAAILIESQRDL